MDRSEDLEHEILAAIDGTRAVVSEISINRSMFLRCMFFVLELRQFPLRQCSPDVLQGILDDITALRNQCCRWKSRILQIYRSDATSEAIEGIMKAFGSRLELVYDAVDDEKKDQLVELRKKLEQASFSPDAGNKELAASICEALYQVGKRSILVEDLSRYLNTTTSALKLEIQEDKRELESQGRLEELREINDLVRLFDTPVSSPNANAYGDSFDPDSIPAPFLCPITGQVMREPVLVEGGATYEKSAIVEWFNRGNTRCPVTNTDLQNLNIVPNRSIENAIKLYGERLNIDRITRSIKKIKVECVEVDEPLNSIKGLIELDPCYKRHVVALDGLEPLVAILKKSTADQRDKILNILVGVGEAGSDCKLRIINAGAVPVLLRILTKCHGNNPDAVRLLYEISELQEGKNAIFAERGWVINIASAASINSTEQKTYAIKILENMCTNHSWVVIEAASTGLFYLLINSLRTGDEAVKFEMVDAITTKLELNDASSAALVSEGVLVPLLELLRTGSVVCKVAAARSLQKLSATSANKPAIAAAGAIPVLTLSMATGERDLQVYSLSTLANLASDREGVAAISKECDVSRIIEMVREEDPQAQASVLRILHLVARDSKALRLKVGRETETLKYLLTLPADKPAVRADVLGIMFQLSADRETRAYIRPTSDIIMMFLRLLEEAVPIDEKELVLGIFSGITKTGSGTREVLVRGNAYGVILNCLQTGTPRMKDDAAAVLARLTDLTLLNAATQQELVRLDAMRRLREALQSGPERAREHAAGTLTNLSKRTLSLTEKQSFLKTLLARLGLKQFQVCAVHSGKCSARTTFCMVEAGVVPLLLDELRSSNVRNAERAIETVLTLVQEESLRIKGVDYLMKNDLIAPVVSLVGRSASLTEKAVMLLEKIFKSRKYRNEKYSKLAKSSLSTTMTSGSIEARKSAAKALMHLGMMARGSTYTGSGYTHSSETNR